MKHLNTAMFTMLAVSCGGAMQGAAICPVTTHTNTDCGYIITIGPGGSLSGALVAGANPYDGSDDALIGILNNSGSTYTGSFVLTGSSVAGGLFGFDSDGICTFVAASYCATAPTGYEGPITTFSNIGMTSVANDTGTVTVTGLAAGGSTFFSLEGSPSLINPVINGNGGAPEPASIVLLGVGLVGLYLMRRRGERG